MTHRMFRNIDPDEFHGREISLHDCISNQIIHENKNLCFILPDGFWVTSHHQRNDSGKTVCTDAAAVDFLVEDVNDILVRVFTRSGWPWSRKTTVEIWEMDRLMNCVNSGACILEFITQYRTYGEQMWHCAIRSNKKPYYRECQLHFPNSNATFYWNDLCLDREW